MTDPRRAEDAVLERGLDRLWQDGQLLQVVLSVWAAGERDGHIDGWNEARGAALMAEEEQ